MNGNKKVFITSNTSWYIYNFRRNTVQALLDEGYVVGIVSPKDSYSVKLQDMGAKHFHIDIDQGGKNPLNDLITLYGFFQLYKKHHPEVVLNFTPKNNIYSTLAARISGAKSINNIAGLGQIFIEDNLTAKLARFLYKISQPSAFKVFFQNDDDRELFIQNNLVPIGIIDRVPGSGVDLSRFTVSSSPNDSTVRFLLIARMLYDKGVGHYVEAARELRDKYGDKVEFRLLGFLDVANSSSVSKAEMSSWVEEGAVTYLGTSDCVEEEIAKVDCMVLPSFYREGVPKSLLEACAMGKPIVTTDNVGCRETVDDGINGYLCQPRSTASLVEQLDKMISLSHDERLIMGTNSRRKVEREFDEKIVIDKYLQAVSSALNS
ncbi:galacturonosyltransferase WbtD [Vibrio crassostreae]|uniref:Glycosyltransferase n=1 Tax=Vibrio crassostreae TaxID=246167 RepID=A0A822N5F3_9VIBR|nr:glycosyltransferase family 4 protein [Vibrio crassostreae]MDH5952965.1 glycosyltransferase family 4 protein [Vibrio crassostreae]TCN07148.1 glycosyltransferase involved in cell wall biosynthesis [Vibrio crassostreae]TCT62641.1 glycosyltransferase involved in cell wall biosynthesis [Vibrio crassostreae]TCT71079.1 glycosyltransferase involved in cell wall biosynthesis [Vibrio crassostreae]TCT83401.1 glycosyltransferase involved in cell wall biosynthesis [Vibrio crassostreae]